MIGKTKIVAQIWRKAIYSNREAEWSKQQVMPTPEGWAKIAELLLGHRLVMRTQHLKSLLLVRKHQTISILNSRSRIAKQELLPLALLQDPRSNNSRADRKQLETWKHRLKWACLDNQLALSLNHRWEPLRHNLSLWQVPINKGSWTSYHNSSVTSMRTFRSQAQK